MRRSKLESYEDILGALVKKPLNIDRLAYETDMDCTLLQKRLASLIRYGLVEERLSSRKTRYAITERGIAVLKSLNFRKYLEKVANTLRVMEDALQVIPSISKKGNIKKE
jgi:predicted transcriptional regulator